MEVRKTQTVEEFRASINEVSTNYQSLLQETHYKALLQNAIQTKRWEDYKKDHVELSDRMMCLRDKLSHCVMVPVGKRALMRGQLVHTNEILVCLGDGWFAKQSARQAADICQRRILHCDEMMKKLKKEEDLLNSRKTFPFESEAFGGNQTQEIIEPYDEEEEKQWREKHRQKEKEYRQKLAEMRKVPKTKIETEEDLWHRLDALDVQEELEDELNRIGGDVEEDVEEDTESEDDSCDLTDDETCDDEEHEAKNTLQRRVSFKEEKDSSEGDKKSDSSVDNLIRIVFKHSDTSVSVPPVSSDEITTPSDIYVKYLKQKTPKSILKPSLQKADYSPVDLEVGKAYPVIIARNEEEIKLPLLPVEPAIKAVSEEVVEHAPSSATLSAVERPVSRFKASRMACKR